MPVNSSLTTSQQETLGLIACGATAYDAAAIAGVHRHMVANWLRLPDFRDALDAARYHQALLRREQADSLAAEAYQTVRPMLTDQQVPSAVRLKAQRGAYPAPQCGTGAPQFPAAWGALFCASSSRAALAIIDRAPAPLPQPPESPKTPEFVSTFVQPPTGNQPLAAELRKEPTSPPPAVAVKIGRNEACPCGSGLKFKRCCIAKAAGSDSQPPIHAQNGPQ